MPVVTTLAGNLVTVDLETRDFEGYVSDVIDSGGLADTYTPDWSDRSELDLGVALVEAFAFMADNLSYYQDRCANEALFPSVVQRRSMIEHCKLIGYELDPPTSAGVELTFVTSGAGTVPERTKVQVDTSDGSESATFELAADFVSTGAGTTTGVTAYEGNSVSEVLGSSDGSADQQYELSSTPLALNPDGTSSLEVTITAGMIDTVWAEVDNFLESGPTDEHFRTEIDENDVVTVIFGDGVNGAVPASGTNNISAVYRVGGGHEGNQVAINKLTKLIGSYSFVTSVTNPAKPTGGADRETVAQAKVNAPLSLKALNRAVTHDDYKALALEVPGVLHAYAYRPTGSFEEHVVIATGGSNPVPTGTWDPYTAIGTGLIGAVGAYLEERKTTPTILYIDPVRMIEIELVMNVYLFSNVRREVALRVIEDAVLELFEAENQVLGQQVPLSAVHAVVEGLQGVDYPDVVQMQRIPNPYHFPLGSSTDLSFGSFSMNSNTIQDTYMIYMTSPTTFDVVGDASGNVGSGTVGTTFTEANSRFSFLATAGVTPATTIDKYRFKTGEYVDNADPEFDEMIKLKDDGFQLTVIGGVG